MYVGGKAPQLPWELPGKPALLTSGSVTADRWWECRAPAPSSQGRTSLAGEPTTGTQGKEAIRQKKFPAI